MQYARILLLGLVAFGLTGALQSAEAQFKRLRERAKATVEQEIDKRIGTTGRPGEVQDTLIMSGRQRPMDRPGGGLPVQADTLIFSSERGGVWANYDFVPGERPLFVEDLTADRVGNFPRRLEFVEGNLEIVEWNGKRFIRGTTYPASFNIVLPEALPERFTVEFDIAPMAHGWNSSIFFSDPGENPTSLVCGVYRAGLYEGYQGGGHSMMSLDGALKDQVFTCRVTADGEYVKVYQNEHRVANVPNAKVGRGDRIYFQLAGSEDQPAFIGNIRVMAGGRTLYDALAAEGRVATQGILFDTGSDVIRPESTPTLKEIGRMLQEHPDLRIAIEGHTDNAGSETNNLTLSERRAAAVKAFMAENYGIDPARLEAQGFGAGKPSAPNDTPEGRQTNRRVELVKL